MANVFIASQAQKEFQKLPIREKTKIRRRLSELEANPFAGKKLVGKLSGLFSLKIWPYRVIYLLKRDKEVWIVHILHRQGVYK